MRYIQKKSEPNQLTQWRSQYRNDDNFGYDLLRKDNQTIKAVTNALVEEQGYLCAYTGIRIYGYQNSDTPCECHIEHLKAQDWCNPSETVLYSNIVACYPPPNSQNTPYGANKKKNWPTPQEQNLFISPLDPSCETRFIFTLRGEIKPNKGDRAAEKTIEKLGLDHKELVDKRKGVIQGLIGKENDLSVQKTNKRLNQLKRLKNGKLDEFCFVLIQALEKHIKRLNAIAQSKSKRGKSK